MKIVVASDSFKGTLSSKQAGEAIAAALRRAHRAARVRVVPVADGGEGTVEALVTALRGTNRRARVCGPLGEPRTARFGLLPHRVCVIEMAASSGLTLVPDRLRDPMRTTTRGTGGQILRALTFRPREILIGVGGSATVDGGCGAAQALGVSFFDRAGRLITCDLCGGNLTQIGRIDVSRSVALDAGCRLTVLCDVTNPLCGPDGAARVFGPQKFRAGRPAPKKKLAQLSANLNHLAGVIERDLGVDVAALPRGGAAGGLAAGLHAYFGAELVGGVDAVLDRIGFDRLLDNADLVVTGEGRVDAQTARGKTAAGIAARARSRGIRCVCVAGAVGPGIDECRGLFDGVLWCTQPGDAPPKTAQSARAALTRAVTRAADDLLNQRAR